MSSLTSSQLSYENEAGAVMLEWAITVIGLLLGLLATIDCSRMLILYTQVSQAAFEGVVAGANYPSLELQTATNLLPTPSEAAACEAGDVLSTFPCGHYLLQQRVKYSLEWASKLSSWNTPPDSVSVSSQYVNTGANLDTDNTVIVSLTANFSGLLVHGWPITATIRGPYMFQ